MEVVVGKLAGFCFGVNHAVVEANKLIDNEKNVYCLGEIVHNAQVIEKLEAKGMKTVESLDEVPDGSTVIFRAHGEAESVYKKAESKNLKVVDLTCGKVKAIHIKVSRNKVDSFIIIIGKKTHPEVIGIKGFAGENSFVIQSEDDILDAYMEYEKTNLGKVFVVSQTTFSSARFDDIREEIETNFCEAEVVVDKTICDATENRQLETRQLAKEIHKMVVIGGKNSSNTKELVNVAKEFTEDVYSVETVKDLENITINKDGKIAVMAGASTPKESIEDVKKYLENL
ncbi:MAG: 4-hydroxy-3-methylbut-2-enyl diphosphate reductase [Clostridia bacterium]|nr:4-hydroxy-3-methylbut-2-enyl diphosphate reductase [Clostridia bacterium]